MQQDDTQLELESFLALTATAELNETQQCWLK